jgi:hypothetical protein
MALNVLLIIIGIICLLSCDNVIIFILCWSLIAFKAKKLRFMRRLLMKHEFNERIRECQRHIILLYVKINSCMKKICFNPVKLYSYIHANIPSGQVII